MNLKHGHRKGQYVIYHSGEIFHIHTKRHKTIVYCHLLNGDMIEKTFKSINQILNWISNKMV